MRLTALCLCGTLLALSSLSWTTADSDEGDLLEDTGFGPCAATLRLERPCRQGQDENTCPYLFSLPPLTVHLPKQLRELEKIMKDLQKLKDNVDQLREMCADCTPNSDQDSTPGQKLPLDRINKPPDQKPKPKEDIPNSGHIPKLPSKNPDLSTDRKTKPNVKPKPGQVPQTGLKTPRPGQMPKLNPKSMPDEIPKAESNRTSKPRPPPRHRPPTGPTLKPGATSAQRPKPAGQLKQGPKTKTDLDPPHISRTTSDGIQNSQTDMPPTSVPIKQTAEVTHPPWDTEFSPSTKKTITLGPKTSNSLETGPLPFLYTLPEGFTISPNSRITSDLRPQTASQPSSIPMTTKPNNIIRGILPSVIPSSSPGSTKLNLDSNTDSSLQAKILHNVEETAPGQTPDPDKMMIPVPSPSVQTTTLSHDFRSTTPATSGPEPLAAESSTPSARELRVKINQVAAFLNNSLNPNGRSLDRRPKENPEDNQGGGRPDSKPLMRIPSKVTAVKRDCSDHLLRGETTSRVYLVTPDIRSKSFPVFCDMELGGGGWTVLQRRQDGSVSFNRTWAEYRSGFGELDGGEFWLGNNMIHLLTRDRDVVLRVELEDFDGVMEYAEYEQFKVASERQRYRLTVGGYSGTAGDALRFSKSYDHNNKPFTTPDRDNDRYPSGNCGAYYSSGWWFDACMAANLNGRYYVGKYTGVRDGIFWGTWHNISTEYYPTNDRRSFKTVRMMIRPKGFAP
ncbi:proteoglycan 4-like [Lates japonicus]